MRIVALCIFILFAFDLISQSQPKDLKNIKAANIKKAEERYTDFGIGVGMARSVIFLSRNIKEFNDATGLNVGLVYGGNNLVRFGADYSQFNSLNIEPTWLNIKARCYELNMQFLARFKHNRALIYPLVGFSLNEFNGFFTGIDDFQNLREKYPVNSQVQSYWLGLNCGLGYEHTIGPLKLYITYKMRVGAQDVDEHLNIVDVCYSFGLRYDIKALKPKYLYRHIFRNTRNRYALDV